MSISFCFIAKRASYWYLFHN